jgi:ATP-dependent DNA helicase DinG
MTADRRIPDSIRYIMKKDIEDAEGNEVLWGAQIDKEGQVFSVRVLARGNEESAPALFSLMEECDLVIHNHPSGGLTPSDADVQVAARLGNQGTGFFIVDNRVSKLYIVAEPVLRGEAASVDPVELGALLGPDGPLAALSEWYEPRPSQIAMLKMTAEVLNSGTLGAVEAGTGVGKSFAYLIPAFSWAAANRERVVISTATINLQQQIMEKDIPLVKKITGLNLKAVLVKGRRNYLCKKRLGEALSEVSLFPEGMEDLLRVGEWGQSTPTGELSDLSFQPEEGVWSRVCSEPDICGHFRCIHFAECWVMKARKEAATAQILVANHHLFFADITFRMSGLGYDAAGILPPFKRVIFDEAHNVEKSATSFFSGNLNRFLLVKYLNRLYRNVRGRQSGLLLQWKSWFPEKTAVDEMMMMADELSRLAGQLDDRILELLGSEGNADLTDMDKSLWQSRLAPLLGDIRARITAIISRLSELKEELNDEQKEDVMVMETGLASSRLGILGDFCDTFRAPERNRASVFWLERKYLSRGEVFGNLWITPLSVSDMMNEAVYEPCGGVVLTSATLTVNKSFRFWAERLGLPVNDESRFRSGIFPSPFDYRNRVLLAVPQDAPPPDNREGFLAYVTDFVKRAVLLSEGRALVLFTSYEMLKTVHEKVSLPFAEGGLSVFRQGDDDRHRLLESFKVADRNVLFATSSFWEGVDVPGDALKLVIICRLPFQVPTDPVVKARMKEIESRGGNSFKDLSLPEAVIRFKQGFGRLMRRQTDHGVVAVLDSRLVGKYYGKAFIDSLPETARAICDTGSLLDAVERFLYP